MMTFEERFAQAQVIVPWGERMDALTLLMLEDPVRYAEVSREFWY